MSIEVEHNWSQEQWDWPLQKHDGIARVKNLPEFWEVGVEVPYFRPDEIEVKAHEGHVIVHCQHAVRSDEHGDISREITRTYKLPGDVNSSTLKSHLSKHGILYISAEKNGQ
jgi:HSP20 family molecular chaperone IbpA